MKKTKQQGIDIYERLFGKVKKELGYSLTCKIVKTGYLVRKWYSRNNYVEDVLEEEVLINTYKNKVYKNFKVIAEWQHIKN